MFWYISINNSCTNFEETASLLEYEQVQPSFIIIYMTNLMIQSITHVLPYFIYYCNKTSVLYKFIFRKCNVKSLFFWHNVFEYEKASSELSILYQIWTILNIYLKSWNTILLSMISGWPSLAWLLKYSCKQSIVQNKHIFANNCIAELPKSVFIYLSIFNLFVLYLHHHVFMLT